MRVTVKNITGYDLEFENTGSLIQSQKHNVLALAVKM
jgi:hypothetical protein